MSEHLVYTSLIALVRNVFMGNFQPFFLSIYANFPMSCHPKEISHNQLSGCPQANGELLFFGWPDEHRFSFPRIHRSIMIKQSILRQNSGSNHCSTFSWWQLSIGSVICLRQQLYQHFQRDINFFSSCHPSERVRPAKTKQHDDEHNTTHHESCPP